MNYKDISPPMTAAEYAAADANRRARARRASRVAWILALVCTALVVYGGMPVELGPVGLFEAKTTARALAPGVPVWVGLLWYASLLGALLLAIVGLTHRLESWGHATGDLGRERAELSTHEMKQLLALSSQVPEVQSIVAAWYAEGRTINGRVVTELLRAKADADAASEKEKLRSAIADRFASASPSAK